MREYGRIVVDTTEPAKEGAPSACGTTYSHQGTSAASRKSANPSCDLFRLRIFGVFCGRLVRVLLRGIGGKEFGADGALEGVLGLVEFGHDDHEIVARAGQVLLGLDVLQHHADGEGLALLGELLRL